MTVLKLGLVASLALATAMIGGVPAFAADTPAPAAAAPAAHVQKAAATKAPAAPSARQQHNEALQTALKTAGEDVTVDGRIGKKTLAALKDYQQKHGLKATGHFDKATVKALGV